MFEEEKVSVLPSILLELLLLLEPLLLRSYSLNDAPIRPIQQANLDGKNSEVLYLTHTQ